MTPPWWTEADQAEWDLVLWTVVDAIFDLERGDPRTAVIVGLAIEWCTARSLLSKAEWYRRRHLQAHLAQVEELLPA